MIKYMFETNNYGFSCNLLRIGTIDSKRNGHSDPIFQIEKIALFLLLSLILVWLQVEAAGLWSGLKVG